MSSTKIADAAPNLTETDAASMPVLLRLPGSPRNTIGGYLRLEDALNALGQHDHPETWGQLPGWSQMPFRKPFLGKRFVRYELQLSGTRARLRRIPVKLRLKAAERRACTQLYRTVRTTMRAALEDGRLTAHALHHFTGDRTPILAPGIWQKQFREIFFTGRTIIRVPGSPDQLADVIIKQDAFDSWMESRRAERAKDTSEAMLRKAGEIIGQHALEHSYSITRDEAFDIVTLAAQQHGREVSERQFKKLVWARRKAKAGRPTKVQKERFAQNGADLIAQVTALFKASKMG
ncbi:hypothetical protein [Methylorubrum rhodinum]|uniref:hypothetical protein n=1 Tax=Methylorubrum rhodinum TaxID=29428 RepID=UPI003BB1D7FC